ADKASHAAGSRRDEDMLAGFGIAQAVEREIGGETVHAEDAQIGTEGECGWNYTTHHGTGRGDAIALPAKPPVDEFAGPEVRRIALQDFADGEGAHRRIQRHRRAVVPLVIGPSALRGIDGEKAIFNQDLALARSGDRLRHQRKVLGLRYPTRPRRKQDLSVFTSGHERSS